MVWRLEAHRSRLIRGKRVRHDFFEPFSRLPTDEAVNLILSNRFEKFNTTAHPKLHPNELSNCNVSVALPSGVLWLARKKSHELQESFPHILPWAPGCR